MNVEANFLKCFLWFRSFIISPKKINFHSFFQTPELPIKFSSRTKNKKKTLGKSSDKMFFFDQGHTKDV